MNNFQTTLEDPKFTSHTDISRISILQIEHRLLADLQQCLFVCLQYWRLQSHGTLIWVYIVGKNDKLRIFSQQNLEDISSLQNSRIDSSKKSPRCFHPCHLCFMHGPLSGKIIATKPPTDGLGGNPLQNHRNIQV